MTLWIARNGFMGYSHVGALVEAETESEAREAGSAALRAVEEREPNSPIDGPDPSYWQIESCERVTLPYVGDTLP